MNLCVSVGGGGFGLNRRRKRIVAQEARGPAPASDGPMTLIRWLENLYNTHLLDTAYTLYNLPALLLCIFGAVISFKLPSSLSGSHEPERDG